MWNLRFPLHQSRRPTWPKSQGSTGAATMGFPSCPQLSLTIHCFQDTTAISGLGAPPPTGETENSPRSVGMEAITPALVATLPHTSPWATPPSGCLGSAQSTQQLFQMSGPKTLDAGSTLYVEWPPATLEGRLTGLSKELLKLQGEMNTALEELLEIRANMDYCCRELDLGWNWLHVLIMPSSLRPRHTIQLQPLPCNGLTWTASLHWTTKW